MNDSRPVTALPSRAAHPSGPPPARTDRWRPARAGLVNLWRYWDETLTFHAGRLLLRGANGSGKSMALELLLPFLLDGDASPGRLTSSARSRGGLYDRLMTGTTEPSRAGFAWVEFRRGEAVFTVGARLRSSTATRKVDLDFFTTSLAVGTGLELLDERREPLSRKALVAAIGDTGRVHGSAEEHRAAVREVLYPGFGPGRYDSLIGALLALRKEKLSQNLDLDKLSAVLSDALPPLDDQDLAVVAEGFERLDRRREELGALERELGEVKALAARQQGYARAVLAAVAHEVRAAETRRDDVTRAEREAAAALEAVQAQVEAAETEAEQLADQLGAADVEVEALRASEAYRSGAALDDLRGESRRLAELVERDSALAESAAEEQRRAAARRHEAAEEHDQAAGNAEVAATDLRRAAVPVAAEGLVADVIAVPPDEAEGLARAWVRSRRDLVAQVRAAVEAHSGAVAHRTFAEEAVAADDATADRRRDACRRAVSDHGEAVAGYAAAVTAWAAGCTAVGPGRVAAALPVPPDDPAAVGAAVARLAADVRAEQAIARRDIELGRAEVHEERVALTAERDPLAEGRSVEPERPAWRGGRTGRAGAPLWRLVDVAAGVTGEALDGLESALTAAGLVDAWVNPDGFVDLADGTADVFLQPVPSTAGGRHVEAAGQTLADFLVALPGAQVAPEVITGVLASIRIADTVRPAHPDNNTAASHSGNATGPGGAAVPHPPAAAASNCPAVVIGLDGTFRLGPAMGRGAAEPAELLGSEAQERRRLTRLAELDAAIAECDARLAELDRAESALDSREAATSADFDAAPDSAPVTAAVQRVADAEARLAEAEDRLVTSRHTLALAEEAVRQALRALNTLAAHHQLPTTTAGLDDVAAALTRLERTAEVWLRRERDVAAAARQLQRAGDDAVRAESAAAAAAANLATSRRDAGEIAVKLAALESAVGVEYRQVLDRLSALDAERRRLQTRSRQLAEERPPLERRLGTLQSELAQAEDARQRAEERRATTHRRFLAAATDGLAADAGLSVDIAMQADGADPGVTAVLASARAVAAELAEGATDESALERLSALVAERLHHARAALGGRVDLSRDLTDEGWWVLRAATSGLRRSIGEVASVLAVELDASRSELAADEERLFEQTLAGSVRRALAERIRLANGLVDGINAQLGTVRTAAGGVEVRLRWEVNPEQPDAVKAARALLLRDPAALTDAERASLQEFVRARVDQARADLEPNAPWEARLRETLDYRAWHRFTLQVAHRDQPGFEPLTPRRLARLSTGERSIVLHLPMLASIAAHYADEAGTPAACPRLILLDELFAGVDTANRAQLFGTFTTWDLDAVFTSDHEWCQYASLDGIAIHHLHPADGDGPVTSTRFTWDGRQRAIDPSAA